MPGRPVVPPPLRHHPARPRLAQPRGRRHVRATCCGSGSTAASTASGSTSRTAWSRRRALRDQVVAEGEEPGSGVDTASSMVERALRDEPMWDQPEVHDVYRRWHRVLAEYPGDRMAVAEAWTQTPESMARYVRPDEMSQAFNFAWLLAPWSATAFADVITSTLDAARRGRTPRRPGCSATTTSIRHATRYGGGAGRPGPRPGPPRWRCSRCPARRTSTRARSSASRRSTSPPEARQDPAWLRTAPATWRDGCRVPIPWSRRRAAVRLRAGHRPAVAPPAGRLGGPSRSRPRRPTRTRRSAFYRAALAARRDARADGRPTSVELLDAGADVLAFRRGAAHRGPQRRRRARSRCPAGEVRARQRAELDGELLPADTAVWLA